MQAEKDFRIFGKKSAKPLDKLPRVCYNNNVKRSEAILINLIRDSGRDGDEQEHAGWLTV